jgi:nicotinamidase-related amidase
LTLTTLDPMTALIVIDLQKGIVARSGAQAVEGVVARAARLADAFRRHGLPVVLVNVAGMAPGRTEQPRMALNIPDGWTDLIPELNRQPGDHLVTKYTPGAFTNTDLDRFLKGRGVTQVVVVGVATSNGVEVTARQAFELGFNVTLAIDAMADIQPEAHDYSIARVFPRIGETGLTDDIIDILDKRG